MFPFIARVTGASVWPQLSPLINIEAADGDKKEAGYFKSSKIAQILCVRVRSSSKLSAYFIRKSASVVVNSSDLIPDSSAPGCCSSRGAYAKTLPQPHERRKDVNISCSSVRFSTPMDIIYEACIPTVSSNLRCASHPPKRRHPYLPYL